MTNVERSRACTCGQSELIAHRLHEVSCPYAYDLRLWSTDTAWIVAGLGALAGETTQAIERMGHGVVAYVVDDGYAVTAPGWWGERPGTASIVRLGAVSGGWTSEYPGARLALGIGDPRTRKRFAETLPECRSGVVADPSAVVMPGASLGVGVVVSAGVVVSHGADVGDHAFVNYNVTLGHDVRVGRYSMICPGAQLMGGVEIGEAVFIGTGAIFLPRVRVGDGAIVGAGAVVLRDVEAGDTVVGNPARSTKRCRVDGLTMVHVGHDRTTPCPLDGYKP